MYQHQMVYLCFFFFNDTATTEIYTLSLHDVFRSHNMQQAARVSDQTAFMYMGELIEYSDTNTLFTTPTKKKTEDYITGRYG